MATHTPVTTIEDPNKNGKQRVGKSLSNTTNKKSTICSNLQHQATHQNWIAEPRHALAHRRTLAELSVPVALPALAGTFAVEPEMHPCPVQTAAVFRQDHVAAFLVESSFVHDDAAAASKRSLWLPWPFHDSMDDLTSASDSLNLCSFSITFCVKTCCISSSIFRIFASCSCRSNSIWAIGFLTTNQCWTTFNCDIKEYQHCRTPQYLSVWGISFSSTQTQTGRETHANKMGTVHASLRMSATLHWMPLYTRP